jgi:Heme oxygenase
MDTRNATPTNKDLFLNNLRTHTMPAHKSLEEVPLSTRIVESDVTKEEYGRYIELMYPVHADAEQNIYPILSDVVPNVEERKKADHIKKDLEHISLPLTTAHERPLTGKMPNMSQAFALGVMYVIEGSTLGGRVILKNIQPSLQLSEENGASYFAGYKANTGIYWKNFLEALTSYPQNEADEKEIIAGADYAFTAIHDFMLR